MSAAELRVIFDEQTIRNYGGAGAGLHSDADTARAQGFPEIISWGTLTAMPFWELLRRVAGQEASQDVALDVRLTKPVCAGDEVTYTVRATKTGGDGRASIDMDATTARFGIVATAIASIPSDYITNSAQGDS